MKIAVWHNLHSGGAKRALYDQIKGLSARGHQIDVWTTDLVDSFLPLEGIDNLHVKEVKSKMSYYTFGIKNYFYSFKFIKEKYSILDKVYQEVALEINKGDYDIVFANSCHLFYMSFISNYVKKPCVIYLGEPYRWIYEASPELPWIEEYGKSLFVFNWNKFKKRFKAIQKRSAYRFLAHHEKIAAQNYDRILVNSYFSRESVGRSYGLDAKVVYLGIDFGKFKPASFTKKEHIVGVGFVHPSKGIDRVLRAVALIEKKKRPELIWIANNANEIHLGKMLALAEELDVVFSPKIMVSDEELINTISTAFVMVYTPRLEPFGLAPLEANACGTSVIGIAEGGVRETIEPNMNGILVQDEDPQAIADAILRFKEDKTWTEIMSKQAMEWTTQTWTLEKMLDRLESILIECSKKNVKA